MHVATNTPRSTDSQGRSHCEKSDESFSKDEIIVIIQKFQSRQLQRQVFAIFTSFEYLGELFGLAKELNLEADVVLPKETTIRSHKVTDYKLPTTCAPVMLLTKMSSAIQQKYHLPIPEQKMVTNIFKNLPDLINIIKFLQDFEVDTTLDDEKWTIIFNSHKKLFFPFI